jgi:hypothetical protein
VQQLAEAEEKKHNVKIITKFGQICHANDEGTRVKRLLNSRWRHQVQLFASFIEK